MCHRTTMPNSLAQTLQLQNLCVCLCVCVSVCVCSCSVTSDPLDYSPIDSFVRGIIQARTLEWVQISFSRGSS